MTVPNPAPQPGAPGPQMMPHPQPSAAAPQPHGHLSSATAAPQPARPPLTRQAARRARLAGGVGGGISWLGLHIATTSAGLLALPFLVAGLLSALAALWNGGLDGMPPILPGAVEWLASYSVAFIVGVVVGLVLLVVGFLVSIRMLRGPGVEHPVGITFAGWGIALVGTNVLTGLMSGITMPFGGVPMMGAPWGGQGTDGSDGDGFGGMGFDGTALDGGQLLGWGIAVVLIGILVGVVVHTAVGVFTWWWMAHAMRPKAAPAA